MGKKQKRRRNAVIVAIVFPFSASLSGFSRVSAESSRRCVGQGKEMTCVVEELLKEDGKVFLGYFS